MAELGSKRGGAGADIYTVLMAIAMLALLATVIFVWYRHVELFSAQPWEAFSSAVDLARLAVT